MTATFDARIDGDDLHDHYLSTPLHDQLDRDLRATWLQQPGPPLSDTEFDQAATEATELTKLHPATPELFDGLVAAIDEEPEPSFWDKLEDWLARWGIRLVALASITVFTYVALAYFNVIPVVQP
ncbi:hypothetical protein [Rhodococcus sp. USK13]|uniref:hypothetical protein n=1 Tax=Rhodococcus sp. USK13 TaxID=2806442 RepID=UPI001BCEC8AD|nr:hypothetical protein [Rhodococcus sp. USK13]